MNRFVAKLSIAFGLLVLLFLNSALAQKQTKLLETDSPEVVRPGETMLVTPGNGEMQYFLRIPKSYDSDKGARIIVFLHGSNSNGITYLRSIENAGWCADDILVCPNGERGNKEKDPYKANNFTFGSAPQIATVTKQIQAAFKHKRTYLGGHSQGGYVTYSCIMNFPELYDGAFPMAGGCWIQNEPNIWESNSAKLTLQKQIPIAIIHGRSDTVVPYELAKQARQAFLHMGYPKLRLFNPHRLGHQFMLSPVPDALKWMDAMNGETPRQSLVLAAGWVRNKQYGWAHQTAIEILKNEDLQTKLKSACEKICQDVEDAARIKTPSIKKSMLNDPAKRWIPKWAEFFTQFGATSAASELVKEYQTNRKSQRENAKELFEKGIKEIYRAKGDKLPEEKKFEIREAGYQALEKLLEEAPCTYEAIRAIDKLKARKPQAKKKVDTDSEK
ncbi:MAG: hypothetical protein AB8B55_21950 [Mariniblastus sp.]